MHFNVMIQQNTSTFCSIFVCLFVLLVITRVELAELNRGLKLKRKRIAYKLFNAFDKPVKTSEVKQDVYLALDKTI